MALITNFWTCVRHVCNAGSWRSSTTLTGGYSMHFEGWLAHAQG